MKHLLIAAFALIFFAAPAAFGQAKKGKQPSSSSSRKTPVGQKRSGSQNGWTDEERHGFLSSCTSQLPWGQDSSQTYCACMLQKIERMFSTAEEANQLSPAKTLELAKQCFVQFRPAASWTDAEEAAFIKECEPKAAKSMGEEKARSYCACMLEKVEKAYPNPVEASNVTIEQISKWTELCLYEKEAPSIKFYE